MLNSLVLFELDDHSLSIEQLLQSVVIVRALDLHKTSMSLLNLNLKIAYFKF